MKHVILLQFFIVLFFISCSSKKQCRDMYFSVALFHSSDSSMTDTTANITAYRKGDMSVIDTSTFSFAINGQNTSYAQINCPYFVSNFTKHDWKIVLAPSGKQYIIQNIRFNSRKAVVVDYDSYDCSNDLFYNVNNKGVSIAGTNGNIYHSDIIVLDY